MNETAVHDHGAMNTNKELARQARGECSQLLTNQILLGPSVNANIVSRCLKIFNFIQRNKNSTATFFKRQPPTHNYWFWR